MATENVRQAGASPGEQGLPDRSRWVFLKDLELPPEMAREAIDYCRRCGYRKADWNRVVEEIKLQHFYGGQVIAYLNSPEGRVVVAVLETDTEDFRTQLARLGLDRGKVSIDCPSIWNDPISRM